MMAAGCTASPQQCVLSADDSTKLRGMTQEFVQANLAGDWAKAASMHTVDAIRMPPDGPMIQGRAAIETAFTQVGTVTAFNLSAAEVEGCNGLAWDRETYSITLVPSPGASPITSVGKALVVFKKQPDGAWLAHRVAWNTDTPAAAAGATPPR